jgi:outer membrane lipoprotein-sorting protein
MSQDASFALILQKPDSVLINIYGPFGIKVGLALVTREEFTFYSTLENKLVTGSSSTENLNRILHIKLSFDELLSMFAGGTFLSDDLRLPDKSEVKEDQIVFTYSQPGSTRHYWIDPATSAILKIQITDSDGNLTLEESFSEFRTVSGVGIPSAIQITQKAQRQSLYLYYSEVSVNSDKPQFTFSIPSNAERIRW